MIRRANSETRNVKFFLLLRMYSSTVRRKCSVLPQLEILAAYKLTMIAASSRIEAGEDDPYSTPDWARRSGTRRCSVCSMTAARRRGGRTGLESAAAPSSMQTTAMMIRSTP